MGGGISQAPEPDQLTTSSHSGAKEKNEALQWQLEEATGVCIRQRPYGPQWKREGK